MQIFEDIRDVHLPGPTFLTIGNFDGLHRGHQALLAHMQTLAARHNPPARTGLITFFPHPLAVLRPDTPLQLLTTPEERLRLAAEQGIDIGIVQPTGGTLAASGASSSTLSALNSAGVSYVQEGAPGFSRDSARRAPYNVMLDVATLASTLEPGRLLARTTRQSSSRRPATTIRRSC